MEKTKAESSGRIEYQPRPEEIEGWCAGCRLCETICSLQNEGICNPKVSRIRIVSWEPSIDVPVTCRQCADPLCAKACPVEAFIETGLEGVLKVDSELCIGCGACAEACPFGAIVINPATGIASKCDLCGGRPLCVEYCPAKVLLLLSSASNKEEKIERWGRLLQEQKTAAQEVRKMAGLGGG